MSDNYFGYDHHLFSGLDTTSSGHDSNPFHHEAHEYNLFSGTDSYHISNEHIYQHADPLSVSNKFSVAPLKLHFVHPHPVNGYVRADGTVVEPYIRDGNGAGYFQSNPDASIENNLNSK